MMMIMMMMIKHVDNDDHGKDGDGNGSDLDKDDDDNHDDDDDCSIWAPCVNQALYGFPVLGQPRWRFSKETNSISIHPRSSFNLDHPPEILQ